MTMDPTTRVDRILPELFEDLADARTPAYLEAAIARASSRPQRPAWTYPGRWLPVQITTQAAPTARMPWRQLGIVALIGLLLAVAAFAYVGALRDRSIAPPFGLAGNGVIALEKDGDIHVADRPGGETRPLVAGPEDDGEPIFSPDGTKLAFLRRFDNQTGLAALMVADADGTNVVQITPAIPGGVSHWSFAPDGRWLIAVADGEFAGTSELESYRKRVVILPVEPGSAPTILDVPLPDNSMGIAQGGGPRLRPTNPQEILVVAELYPDGPRGIRVYDQATGGIRTIVEPPAWTPAAGDWVENAAWSPTGEHISYDLDGRARVVAADGSGDRALDDAPGTTFDRTVSPWSNDGTRMVIVRYSPQVDRLEDGQTVVVSTSGDGEPVELACGPTMDIECAPSWIWSPDDSMLIGRITRETSSSGVATQTESYQQADPDTGQVTELVWDRGGRPAWQRVAP